MYWYLKVLKNYAGFGGRAQRMEYWMFALINVIISVALGFLDGMLGLASAETGIGPLGGLYTLAILIPGIAVAIRRLHDTGRSGFWVLIAFVPCIGALVLFYYFVQDSEPGSNQYGPNPKQA